MSRSNPSIKPPIPSGKKFDAIVVGSGRATGVRVIDEQTHQWHEFYASIIFLNASALGSTYILLNSKSKRFPNGMDDSGQLGRNLMDHHFHVGARADYDHDLDKYYYGRHPAGLYIPRFRNLLGQDKQSFTNPSLTYMALSARAADYAVKALKRGDLPR